MENFPTGLSPAGKPMTLKMRSSWSWWYGLLVLMSSWRQWNMGSDVSSSAKMQPIAQMSDRSRAKASESRHQNQRNWLHTLKEAEKLC